MLITNLKNARKKWNPEKRELRRKVLPKTDQKKQRQEPIVFTKVHLFADIKKYYLKMHKLKNRESRY